MSYNRLDIALKLAPPLQRYDFSVPSQYDDWAVASFKAADAFIKLAEGEAKIAHDKAADAAIQAMNKKKPEVPTETVAPVTLAAEPTTTEAAK